MKNHLVLFLFFLLAGCAGRDANPLPAIASLSGADSRREAENMLAQDPKGPLPSPALPPDLRAAGSSAPALGEEDPIPYELECLSPEAPELAEAFEKGSLLYQMQEEPPTSMTGIRQRLDVSLATGRSILQSFGYYAGKVEGEIVSAPSTRTTNWWRGQSERDSGHSPQVIVRVRFSPGPRYSMGKTSVMSTGPVQPESLARPPEASGGEGQRKGPGRIRPLPVTLVDVGLLEGAPARAADVLAAVDRVRDMYQNRGYPQASIAQTRYVANHEKRTLEADVRVTPGYFARMGEVEPKGEVKVRQRYLNNLRTWRPGVPWNQERVEAFRNALRETGLFRSIDLEPSQTPVAEQNGQETRDLVTTLLPAPERTLSGAIKYDTDFGPGIQGTWEHRNLTGRGDSLRITMPLWMDMQELSASYRLPYFLRRDQTFLARGGALHQITDAYELQSGGFASGLERRFTRRWSGSLMGSVEGGSIKDPEEPRREYLMLGLPAMLTYDSANNPLNATRGLRFIFSAAPYTGTYNEDFNIVRTRTDVQAFLPLASEDTLVLALRGVLGGLWGTMAPNVPPTVRFYSGGGGSVRGYEYQSLGPRNDDDEPLGGAGLVEMSVEPRLKIGENWGLVAFLDGGMAYEEAENELGKDLRFGVGGGIRYYTPIGPVRLDVATPLNPRDSDEPLQFYISIGQSF